MKLSNQVLRSRCVGSPDAVEYLDLSNLGLIHIGRLASCPKLETLILRGNRLQDASGLDICQQLWHLDLSNNQLRSVDGLPRFLALGTLVLANNQLRWQDLADLRHMNILSLSLHGNLQLEKDPYYRIHVIDCLPKVWMLDGRLVTSAERIQVRQFFQDSALTDRPVRRKLRKDGFVPSALKKIEIDGIFGKKAVRLVTSFPKNAVLNVETDWKRLQYLARNLQEDINLEWQYTLRGRGGQISQKQNLLPDLFDARAHDRERCNMILLMLVASLDFVLPTHLVRDTLETGKLLILGNVQTMDLFLLPRSLRSKVVSLLVSAVKIDREENEDGGLYSKLYLCLYHMVAELTKLSETTSANQSSHESKLASQLRDYKCLLATEVVQLMCIVPSFFDYLDRDIGVMNLVRIATADPDINDKLLQISGTKTDDDKGQNTMFKEMADFLLMKVQEQLQNLTNRSPVMSVCDRILSKSGALPMKGENTPVCKADYLVRGVETPDSDPPAVNPLKPSPKARARFPHLGDRMLLGPQTVGKIISLPQPTMALVIIDAVPVPSGAVEHKLKESEQHYTYVNMDMLEWDASFKMWKPKGTVGDKFTLQAAEDFNREVADGEDSYRPGTPEAGLSPELKALQASTPLMYTHTPRQHIFVPTESAVAHKHKTRRPQRPLSSVYKERLKLSLDLSRRAQSAGARQPFAVTYGPKASTPKNPKALRMQLDRVPGMKLDLKGVAQDRDGGASNPTSTNRLAMDTTGTDRNTQRSFNVSGRHTEPSAQTTPKGGKDHSEKENKPPGGEATPGEHEAQPSHAGSQSTNEKQGEATPAHKPSPTVETARSDSCLTVRKKVAADTPRALKNGEEDSEEQRKEIFMTAVGESYNTGIRSYSGPQLAGRNRPVSAIERQHEMAAMGRVMPDSAYHTEFQQQRIDAWKQATRPTSSQPKASQPPAQPPPQPPSSPIPNEASPPANLSRAASVDTISTVTIPQPVSDYNVLQRRMPRANLWLAGGRDLFWEGLKSRPKSGHTPGWKEGLPDNMKPRPRSAAARLHRRSKTASVTSHRQSSTRSDSGLPGTMLNDLADLPESRQVPLAPVVHNVMSRRYSPQRGMYDEDPLPGPVADNAYSPLTVWSYQRLYGSYGSGLPCVYENYLDELDYESFYSPTCNTPTLE